MNKCRFFKDYYSASERPYVEVWFNYGRSAATTVTLSKLADALKVGFSQADRLVGVSIYSSDNCKTATDSVDGHAMTCYGYETNSAGELTKIYMCNSDDASYEIFPLEVRLINNIAYLYDPKTNAKWKYSGITWYIGAFAYINTPQILQDMLAEYSDPNTPLVWNGKKTDKTWRLGDGLWTNENLPTEEIGWAAKAEGEYFASFYDASRPVEFGDQALASDAMDVSITVDGAVSTPRLIMSGKAEGASFAFAGKNSAAITTTNWELSGSAEYSFSNLKLNAKSFSSSGAGGIVLNTGAQVVVTNGMSMCKGSSLVFNGGSLQTNVTMSSGSSFSVQSRSSLTGNLVLAGGAKLDFALGGGTAPLLSLTGTLTQQGTLTLSIVGDYKEDQSYALLSTTKSFNSKLWISSNVQVDGFGFDALYWDKNTLYFRVQDSSVWNQPITAESTTRTVDGYESVAITGQFGRAVCNNKGQTVILSNNSTVILRGNGTEAVYNAGTLKITDNGTVSAGRISNSGNLTVRANTEFDADIVSSGSLTMDTIGSVTGSIDISTSATFSNITSFDASLTNSGLFVYDAGDSITGLITNFKTANFTSNKLIDTIIINADSLRMGFNTNIRGRIDNAGEAFIWSTDNFSAMVINTGTLSFNGNKKLDGVSVVNAGDMVVEENTAVRMAANSTVNYGTLSFLNNKALSFDVSVMNVEPYAWMGTNPRTDSATVVQTPLPEEYGAIINKGTLTIAGTGSSLVFDGNGLFFTRKSGYDESKSSTVFRRRAITSSGSMYIAALKGNSIYFYDPVYSRGAGTNPKTGDCVLNAYLDADGALVSTAGSIVFSGAHAKNDANLSAKGYYFDTDLQESVTSRFRSLALKGGSLTISDGARIETVFTGLTVSSSAGGTKLTLSNAVFDGLVTMEDGTRLELSGFNVLNHQSSLSLGDSVTVKITPSQLPAILVNGSLKQNGHLTLDLTDVDKSGAVSALMTVGSFDQSLWNTQNVTVIGGDFSKLYWNGDTLCYGTKPTSVTGTLADGAVVAGAGSLTVTPTGSLRMTGSATFVGNEEVTFRYFSTAGCASKGLELYGNADVYFKNNYADALVLNDDNIGNVNITGNRRVYFSNNSGNAISVRTSQNSTLNPYVGTAPAVLDLSRNVCVYIQDNTGGGIYADQAFVRLDDTCDIRFTNNDYGIKAYASAKRFTETAMMETLVTIRNNQIAEFRGNNGSSIYAECSDRAASTSGSLYLPCLVDISGNWSFGIQVCGNLKPGLSNWGSNKVTAVNYGVHCVGGYARVENNDFVEFFDNKATDIKTDGSAASAECSFFHNARVTGNWEVSMRSNEAKASGGSATASLYMLTASENGMYMADNRQVSFVGNTVTATSTSSSAEATIGLFSVDCSMASIENNAYLTVDENTVTASSNSGIPKVILDWCNVNEIKGGSNGAFSLSENTATATGKGATAQARLLSDGGKISSFLWIYFMDNKLSAQGMVSKASNGVGLSNATLSGNGKIYITKNAVSASGQYSSAYGAVAALRTQGDTLSFSDNSTGITIASNAAIASGPSSSAFGGAIYVYAPSSTLSFVNNGNVVFQGNLEADSKHRQLRSIYMDDKQSGDKLELVAAEGKSITIMDSIYAKGASSHLGGDIIFTGESTETDLADAFSRNSISGTPTQAEIDASRTSYLGNLTYDGLASGGSLQVKSEAVLVAETLDSSGDILLDNARLQTTTAVISRGLLDMRNGSVFTVSSFENKGDMAMGNSSMVITDGGTFTTNIGSSLSFSGSNTIDGSLRLSLNSTIVFNLASATTEPMLSISGGLVQDGALTINLVGSKTQETQKLITVGDDFFKLNWNTDKIHVMGASLAELYWDGDTLYYGGVNPKEGCISWDRSIGEMVWSVNSLNYDDGQNMIFQDKDSGEIELLTQLAPSSVLVENSTGHDYTFVGEGSLTGEMRLTKEGQGSLTLSTENTYAGGTELSAGTLVAGNDNAFGAGAVTVTGGTLDLGGREVSNAVALYGGTLTGATGYKGDLTVSGTATLTGETTAKTLTMTSGSLSGGSVDNTAVTAKSGSISSAITGGSSLTVSGALTLGGTHTYTGATTVSSGTLTLNGTISNSAVTVARNATLSMGSSAKIGKNITVNAGKLKAATSGLRLASGQTLTMNGGTLDGSLTTVTGSTFATSGAVSVTGGLTLGGGAWDCGSSTTLTVTGSLALSGLTRLDVSDFAVGSEPYVLATYGSFTGDLSSLSLTGTKASQWALVNTGNQLQLVASSIQCATLRWTAGAKGVWQADGTLAWGYVSGVESDNCFHNGDEVIFGTKAKVTIKGNVNPGSVAVEVTGKDTLTLSAKAGKGAIMGDAALTMTNTGTLTMNAENFYSGGTTINRGIVKATGARSFGTGTITLNAGTLDFGGKAVANDVDMAGSYAYIAGAGKYAGALTVDNGTLVVNGTGHAGTITLVKGKINGGTIKDTAITLGDGTISSAISGKSSVTVTGEGTLTGKLSYTGGTMLAGGTLASDFTVSAKQTLAATTGTVGGDLTLGGGSILLADDMALTVSGAVKLTKASTLDVSSLDGSATIAFDSLTGDTAKFLKLSAPTEGRKSYAMEIGDKSITVKASGDNTALTWLGAKGKWEVAGTQQWMGATDDNRFYHGDNVTFDSAATVTLATKLAPGSVTVQGDGAVTFSGSGSIAGDGALIMSGTNTLKLNATNTYTGGTVITNGTVLATGVDSFGKGDITLSGGTLNLGKKAIKNNITVTNNATILNAKGFAGVITVQGGTLSLTDSLTGTLVLNGGTLDLSGVKSIAKLTFGNVVCEAETEIVDAKGQHYAFVDGKLVPTDRTLAAVPVPQHAELPGAGLYTTMMRAQLDGNRAAFDSIRQLMGTGEPSSADGRYRFAAQATSASTDMKDYRRQSFGGLVMVEEVFSDKAVGGLSLNYEHADINPDGAGKYESDDTRVNAHLLVSSKNWQSRSIAGIGIHDYDVNHSSATGHSFNLMEEISRTIAVDDKSVIAPFVRMETGYNVIGSINDGVLSIDKQTAWSTDVTLGARFVKTCDFGSVVLEAGVTKAIGDQGGAIGASLVDDPATRAALSPSSRNRWSATLGGSVQIPVGTRSSLHAGATLRFHGGTTEVNANVGYSITF